MGIVGHEQRLHIFCGRFVDKVRTLDPAYLNVMPWQPRSYSRKRGRGRGEEGEEERVEGNEPQRKKLFSPLLAKEEVRIESNTVPDILILSYNIIQQLCV